MCIRDRCEGHGLMLTGHMMEEPTLKSQTAALGEVMRSLSYFQLPGIDMLCDRREYTTAKQAQSVSHQYGREGVLSELYGVTGWDFDFRGHKLQGDWQAALGVTVRTPHLSWVSMNGEAKRDYPASINYQAPWYKRYSLIEDHFARVNTAMTRGKCRTRIAVLHPVESYWLHWGVAQQTAGAVSYTHLDVYKRQPGGCALRAKELWPLKRPRFGARVRRKFYSRLMVFRKNASRYWLGVTPSNRLNSFM